MISSHPPSDSLAFDEAADRQALSALRSSRFQRLDSRFRAFKRAGLDGFLLRVLREGALTRHLVEAEIQRWKNLVSTDPNRADDIKEGFRVFDALAQRIALAGAPLDYVAKNNGPRDLLSTFAGAFHR